MLYLDQLYLPANNHYQSLKQLYLKANTADSQRVEEVVWNISADPVDANQLLIK